MTRGFTLIETLVYIALFSFIMGSTILCVYGIAQSGDQFGGMNESISEGEFVTSKLNWALTSARTIEAPLSGYGTTLSLTLHDGTRVDLRLRDGAIEMSVGGASYLPLTTENVHVEHLGFMLLAGMPEGIEASTTIDGVTFMTRRYLPH